MRILFANLGYATGINGTLRQHIGKSFRHALQSRAMQNRVLVQFKAIIEKTDPDLCCIVELDQGSVHSAFLNQMQALVCARYPVSDVTSKYGPDSPLSKLPFHTGKSNGFLAKETTVFSHLYFEHGTKRLIYQIDLAPNLTLFFAHFSLQRKVRARQFLEIGRVTARTAGRIIIFGDFNTLSGLSELSPLIADGRLILLNSPDVPTFRFHRWQTVLDLCLASPSLVASCRLQVIDQPFSDHDALLLEIDD
jgi:endonuclease/exonuclease/phosphatase family metal-dependent hydrolase